jgi:hypothetical protein
VGGLDNGRNEQEGHACPLQRTIDGLHSIVEMMQSHLARRERRAPCDR